jgi:hypothetical protein
LPKTERKMVKVRILRRKRKNGKEKETIEKEKVGE